MKIKMKMKATMTRMRQTGLLLAALALAAQAHAAFTGDFAPGSNWELKPQLGTVGFIGNTQLDIKGPDTTWLGGSTDQANYLGPLSGVTRLGTPQAGTISFDWALSSTLTVADAVFSYGAVGGPFTTVLLAEVGPGTANSSYSIFLPAGSQFSFALYTFDSVKGKSTTELLISNFSFVPEASTFWAGGLLLGMFVFAALRQLARTALPKPLRSRGTAWPQRLGLFSALAFLATTVPVLELQATQPLAALPDMSLLTPFATFGPNYNDSAVTINGPVGISQGGKLNLMAPSTINGNVYLASNITTLNIAGTINGQVFSNLDLTAAQAQVFSASATFSGMPADTNFGNVSGGLTYSNINGIADVVVIDMGSLTAGSGQNVTFVGDPGDFFVLNISNGMTLGGNAAITNGEPGHIFVNMLKTGSLGLIAKVGNVINGTLLIPYASATLHSVSGAIYSGDGEIKLMSDATVNYVPFPNYSVGNRVWFDNGAGGGTNNNGIMDGGEAGISNVVVQIRTNGTVLAATTTDADGYYRFDFLPPGSNYNVFIPPSNFGSGPLSNLIASPFFPVTPFADETSKGIPLSGGSLGVVSGTFILGPGLQPLGEPDTNSFGAGAHGPTGDTNDNLTIDFGFTAPVPQSYSVGNRVWFDNVVTNGFQDGGEPGIPNVLVELLADTTVLAATNTDANGYYRFDGLPAGSGYSVFIPASNFLGGGPLDGLVSTLFYPVSALSLTNDMYNRGTNADPAANGVQSVTFAVGPGLQPTNEIDISSGAGAHGPQGDTNDILTIDFGFVTAPALYSVGNRVWLDTTVTNGFQDSGEMGLPNVLIELRDSVSNAVAFTNTDASGYYRFDGLSAGTYTVFIPTNNFETNGALFGLTSSPFFPTNVLSLTNDMYNRGSGSNPTVTGVSSLVFQVGPGLQPLNETDIGPGAGAHGPTGDTNDLLTIDFGFFPTNGPTLALLKSIAAVAVGHSVYVGWETASEIDTVAFGLVRLDGNRQVLIGEVPASGSETGGAYVLPDPGASFPGTYTYLLFEDTRQGRVNLVGTYQLQVTREPAGPTKKAGGFGRTR